MKRLYRGVATVLCVLSIVACSNATAPAQNTDSTSTSASNAVVVPTPTSNEVGTVSGRLTLVDQQGQVADIGGVLPVYLGTIIKSDAGVEGLVGLDKGSAPKATPDAQGHFAFTEVSPGRYGLMLDTPQGAILLNDQTTGSDFIIEVEGGKIRDLGALQYTINMGN